MRPEDKKYILENIGKKSIEDLSRELGLKERKIRRFIEKSDVQPAEKPRRGNVLKIGLVPEEGIFKKKKRSKTTEVLIFSVIVIGAFLVRLIYLDQIKTSPFFVPFYHGLDDYLYDTWARSIASGNILGDEVFYGLPLYPYFLGFLYFISKNNIFFAKAAQFFIGSLSCGLIYLIGRKVFNRTVGIIAAAMMAFYSMAIFFEGFFVSAFLAVFLNSLAILLLLSLKKREGLLKCAGAGFIIGLSSLANASILVFLVFAVLWLFAAFKDRPLARRAVFSATLVAGTLLAIIPVTVRNYVVGGDLVPVTAHSGITFYAGNNPLSDGSFKLPKAIGTSVVDSKENAETIAERITAKELKPSEISSFWFGQGVTFMKKEPVKYIKLAFSKMLLFWNAREIPDILPLAFFKRYSTLLRMPLVNYAVVLPLAILGMLISLRCRNADIALLYLFVFSIFISTTIYFVNSRYRFTAVPCMSIFAAAAIYWLYDTIKRKRYNVLVPAVIALIFLAGVTQIKILDFGMAQAHNSLAIILKRKGLHGEAITEYKRAIELAPDYDSPYFNLGLLYFERGDYGKAIDSFQGALKLNPDFVKAHNYIGQAYLQTGKRGEALRHWRRSLKLNPDQPEIKETISRYR